MGHEKRRKKELEREKELIEEMRGLKKRNGRWEAWRAQIIIGREIGLILYAFRI